MTHLVNAMVADDRKGLRDRIDRLRDRNTTPEQFMKRVNAGTVDDLEILFGRYSTAGVNHSIVALSDVDQPGSLETFADVISRFTSP